MKRNPIQPMYYDKNETLRFKENKVIVFIKEKLESFGFDLNRIHSECEAPGTDWNQFNMLIGYSVSGCPIRDKITRLLVDDRVEEFRRQHGLPELPDKLQVDMDLFANQWVAKWDDGLREYRGASKEDAIKAALDGRRTRNEPLLAINQR